MPDTEVSRLQAGGYIFGNAAHVTGLPPHGDAGACTRGTVAASILPGAIGDDRAVFLGAAARVSTVRADRVTGDGAGLERIDASACGGTIDPDRVPSEIKVDIFEVTHIVADSVHGTWSGGAAGITVFPATEIHGAVPPTCMPVTVDLGAARGARIDLDGDLVGTVHGDGGGVTRIPGPEIRGIVSPKNMPTCVSATRIDVHTIAGSTTGAHCGNGSGATLDAGAFSSGTIAPARLPASLAVCAGGSAAVSGDACAARIHGDGGNLDHVSTRGITGTFQGALPELTTEFGTGDLVARRIGASVVTAQRVVVKDMPWSGTRSWSGTVVDSGPLTLGIADVDMDIVRIAAIGAFELDADSRHAFDAPARGEILDVYIPVSAGRRVTVTSRGTAHVSLDLRIR